MIIRNLVSILFKVHIKEISSFTTAFFLASNSYLANELTKPENHWCQIASTILSGYSQQIWISHFVEKALTSTIVCLKIQIFEIMLLISYRIYIFEQMNITILVIIYWKLIKLLAMLYLIFN